MDVENNEETIAGDAGNIGDAEDSRSEREVEVNNTVNTQIRVTVTNRFRGRSTTKFFPWNSRTTIGMLKRKVAREFRLPKEMRFSLTGEAGRRIRTVNNGDKIFIKKERGARQLAQRNAVQPTQSNAVQQHSNPTQPTQSTQKSPQERRQAALKMLLTCLEV